MVEVVQMKSMDISVYAHPGIMDLSVHQVRIDSTDQDKMLKKDRS